MDIAVQKLILDQVRQELCELNTSKYDKSSHRSLELRKNGNNCFCKGNYEESIKFYNQSLLSAPWNSREFYFALANRAAAFYHLSRFQECLQDIDNAFKHGYPLESAGKLLLKQSVCRKNLKKEDKIFNDRLHQNELFLHPDIEMIESPDRGKGFAAKAEIPEGSLVLVEKALVNSLLPDYFPTHCYHCLRYLNDMPFPCKNCNQVSFCDKNCAAKAWSRYHNQECKYLDFFHFTEQFHYSPKMALKILLTYGVNSCISFHREYQSKSSQSKENNYREVYFMAEHSNDGNDYRLFTLKIIAFFMEVGGHSLNEEDFYDLQEILIKHFRQILVNAIAIHSRDLETSPTDKNHFQIKETEIGCGLFTKFRVFNHSCKPNTLITHYDGDRMTMETVDSVQIGQELVHAYGVHYKYQVRSVRQKLLKESYFFECNCEACSKDMQPINKAFLCPNCKGPVVCDGAIVCLNCKKKDHIDVEKTLSLAKPCINFIQIEEDEMAKDMAKLKIVEKSLAESYIVLSKVLYKTHQELAKLIKKLLFCWEKLDKVDKHLVLSKQLLFLAENNFEFIDVNVLNAALTVLHSFHYQPFDLEDPEYVQVCSKIAKLCSKLFPANSKVASTILEKYQLLDEKK